MSLVPETAALSRSDCGSISALLSRLAAGPACHRIAVLDGLEPERRWTWGDLLLAACRTARTFEDAGLTAGSRLVHIGSHCPDWVVIDLACLLAGIVHVALHADATAAEHQDQLGWINADAITCTAIPPASSRRLSRRLRLIEAEPLAVLGARVSDSLVPELRRRASVCDPDAAATIFLSSGTTGRPKGIVHSQRALATNAIAAAAAFLDEPEDVRLSWLPMSHALARVGDLYTAIVRGGCLNLVTDRSRLLDACRAAPPAVILGVPAFFDRLSAAADAGSIGDLSQALGGRVRVCVSGGAALRQRTAVAFTARGVPLVEGYGLAEAGPVVAVSNPRISRPGVVGLPLPGVELAIDDRPDMAGQLLVRTVSRCLGVIDPAQGGRFVATDPDDWLQTGDRATIEADGQLRIDGRLSDTIALSSGVKVPPAAIEAVLAEDDAVAQVCVVGHGLPRPVAIIVPEPNILRAAIRRMGLRVFSRRQAVRHPRVVAWLTRRLTGRQACLPRAWRTRSLVISDHGFTADRGEATESLKLKRATISRHFAAEIEQVGNRDEQVGEQRHERLAMSRARFGWLANAVWGGGGSYSEGASGFAAAAERHLQPLPERLTETLSRAEATLNSLRAEGQLYARLPGWDTAFSRPPLADAPRAPEGVLTRATEDALGADGLWGLHVPERFGGAGGTVADLARAITRLAGNVPTVAGMLSVHSTIGAVAAVAAFGTAEQQARYLPGLAQGRPLSIFGATEPDAGCDLGGIRSRLERSGDRLLLTGTKMFITGATHGRLVKLLASLDGRPTIVLVQLPATDTPQFQLLPYALHPLKHAANAALAFTAFEVRPEDILAAPETAGDRGSRDGMAIVWHGLNRGRIALTAQAAGTCRLLLAQAHEHAQRRRTWGEPIARRELVQARLARMAAASLACESLASWAAAAVDAGQSGELEAITAKVVASENVRESAIDALGIHGGRAFLVGHPLGDSFHDHFAVTVYEGESDLLGLALFKGFARHHPVAILGREATAVSRAAAWLSWRISRWAMAAREDQSILDRDLRRATQRARGSLDRAALAIDRAIRQHGRSLAERQLLMGELSARVRSCISVLAVAHHADRMGDERSRLTAHCWCDAALARANGQRGSAAGVASSASLGRLLVSREAGSSIHSA